MERNYLRELESIKKDILLDIKKKLDEKNGKIDFSKSDSFLNIAIKDDYEAIVRKMVGANDLWLVSDTCFGFIDWRGKRVMDRLMPMVNMYIEMRDGWERHQLRYHALNVGLLYRGNGDQSLLEEWCERTAANIGGRVKGLPRGKTAPGTKFVYNNWDFNVAGTIFEMRTGKSIYDVFEADIARPLQLQDWDRSKHKRTGDASKSIHLAYHFNLSTRDMARLGELMLRKGKWGDKQVIPADWVEESLRSVSTFPAGGGYGYMWWRDVDDKFPDAFKGAFAAHGMYGQRITVLPALDMVIAHKSARNGKHPTKSSDYRDLVRAIIAARN